MKVIAGNEGDRNTVKDSRNTMTALLLKIGDEAFDRRAWHGTPLWGAIRGVTARQALWRPGRDRRRHCIWELVLHTAYWKYIVRRRLTRDQSIEFPRTGSNFPALPAAAGQQAWRRDVALLREQHRLLRETITHFPAKRLAERGWRSTWTNAAHIYGVAAHDLYHAGQIQLLKRLMKKR